MGGGLLHLSNRGIVVCFLLYLRQGCWLDSFSLCGTVECSLALAARRAFSTLPSEGSLF